MGVVAALRMEARTLGPAVRRPDGLSALGNGTLLSLSGMGYAAATMGARNLIEAGVCALMSFGMAGGLDPRLGAGALVLPSAVISREGARISTSKAWHDRLRDAAVAAQLVVTDGELLTTLHSLDSVAAKSAALRDTGAVAVDMESLAVAEVAAGRNLPFVAVRVIVDTALDELPGAVVAASREGQVRIGQLIGALALAPTELMGLVRLARRYRIAVRSLAAVARATRRTRYAVDVRAA